MGGGGDENSGDDIGEEGGIEEERQFSLLRMHAHTHKRERRTE